MKVIPETCRAHQIWYLRFLCQHWIDTSAGGLLVLEGITRSVVSASVLTWFIIYIYYRNLQFLNNVIINKTKVLHHQALVTLADFEYPVFVFWFHCPQNFELYLDFHSSILSIRYGGHSINASCALNLISTFSLQKSDQSGEFLNPVCKTL